MLLEQVLKCSRVKVLIVRDQVDDGCQVGEQVALVAVCQYSRDTSVVKLNLFVVNLDEASGWVLDYQGPQSRLDHVANFGLDIRLVMCRERRDGSIKD